jgi:hypothetical protein
MKLAVIVLAAALCGGVVAHASAQSDPYKAPRTSFGQPDLQGVWTNQSLTNLTRPPGVASLTVSDAEAQRLARLNFWVQAGEGQQAPTDTSKPPPTGEAARFGDQGYNSFWLDPGASLARIRGELRTSFITTPADGQMPLSAEGRKLIAAYEQRRAGTSYMTGGNFAHPEELPISERCLIGFSNAGGPVMLNPVYNSNYQIVQSPDHVMILVEMVHDVRVIPLSGAHRPDAMPRWLGDSLGRWEGDTLVVETRNLHPDQALAGPVYLSSQGKVIERFTRVSPTEIFYEFRVEDPVFYSEPWGGEIPFRGKTERMYEYACHEGNYAAANILGGSRIEEERLAAAGAKPTGRRR